MYAAMWLLMVGSAYATDAHTISGTVTEANGVPVTGVRVDFGGALPVAMTDEAGRYAVAGAVEGASYTIVPSKDGMSFSPTQRTVTMASGDEVVDFIAEMAVMPLPNLLLAPPTAASAPAKGKVTYPTLLYPLGGETWKQGGSYNIRWTYPLAGPMRISLRVGSLPVLAITNSTPNDGSFWWKVPATLAPGPNYRILVDEGYYGDLSGDVTIERAHLVTYPSNAGVSWQKGQSYKIQWQGFGGSHVKIQLYRAGSLNRLIAWAAPNCGSYWWKVPASQATGTNFKIKITGESKSVVYDFSDKNFTVFGTPKVTDPSLPGIVWPEQSGRVIKWQGFVASTVRIELLKSWAVMRVITPDTPNDGAFWWKMPYAPAGSDYRIRITATNDPNQHDHSNNNFTVEQIPRVLYPTGAGILWLRGQPQTIRWTGFPGDTVNIHLQRDYQIVTQIASGTPNDGKFIWQVPANQPRGRNYTVLVSRPQKVASADWSDNEFMIGDQPRVVVPSLSGIVWATETSEEIRWRDFPGAKVKIELLQYDSVYRVISAGTPNDGKFVWAVTDDKNKYSADHFRIKVSTLPGTQFSWSDKSNNYFSIHDM